MSTKDLEEKLVRRGYTIVVYKQDQELLVWKDRKVLYMASKVLTLPTPVSVASSSARSR